MKKLLTMILILGLASTVGLAQESYYYGWEDGTPEILGLFGTGEPPMILSVATTPVYGGTYSLQIVDNSPSGTPQAFVAWITGLSDGDIVTAGFWRYDDTPGASPSVRIWAHWNDDPLDINGYSGSAGGNSDYGEGLGWDYHEWTWTVEAGHTGIVIEARTYSSEGHTVWIDDLCVTIPERDGIELFMPGSDGPVANETSSWSQVKALY